MHWYGPDTMEYWKWKFFYHHSSYVVILRLKCDSPPVISAWNRSTRETIHYLINLKSLVTFTNNIRVCHDKTVVWNRNEVEICLSSLCLCEQLLQNGIFFVSFIFMFFPNAFKRINNTGKNKTVTCPDLIHTEKSLSLPINIYSLVY